ncbi:MAG TPA: tripartite tricarboxylate transporter substrate binding protein [Casimicrobiaceae bacterium]|jgi:tripartite-type tricarboxylate transporter receptor subunit TctC|nr:tripartite tricarboxylate transporter substrate binding protein [Casimicrobiaceae bacterium]
MTLFARRMTRAALAALGVAIACLALPALAADAWPTKPVKIVVPSPPGDGSDLTARVVADKLQAAFGQPFIVENKPGAGGVVAAELVAHSAPDGYTLIMGNAGSHGINAAVYTKLSYDAVASFAPISMISYSPNVLVVNPASPIHTVQDLISAARAKPGAIDFASGGQGSSAHMSMELFKYLTKTDLHHIPYKGATPALTDIIAGTVPLGFFNLPPAIGHIHSGKVRALAVTTAERWPALPDVPTVAEAGVPGFETVAWFGLLAPAATPRPIVERLATEIRKIVAMPEVKARIEGTGAKEVGSTPEEFAKRIHDDVAKWKRVAAAANVHLD